MDAAEKDSERLTYWILGLIGTLGTGLILAGGMGWLSHVDAAIAETRREQRGLDRRLIVLEADLKHIIAGQERLSETIGRNNGELSKAIDQVRAGQSRFENMVNSLHGVRDIEPPRRRQRAD